MRIVSAHPITEGWSAGLAAPPGVSRCRVTGVPGHETVVVKTRWRIPGGQAREIAGLTLAGDAGPRLLGHDDGVLVLADLGSGPALEDLLVGTDPDAATTAFEQFAAALGRLHAATLGRADEFYRMLPGADPALDRCSPATLPVAGCWQHLGGLLDTGPADAGLAAVVAWLGTGPTALSNGDVAPQNCRIAPGGRVRLLDFEGSVFHHPLLDAAHLRLPFYGGPCWSRIPAGVGLRVEAAYRAAAGWDDDDAYATGLAYAISAWTVVRLARLPKLLDRDETHPLGFTKRGQLLDTLQVAVEAGGPLRDWFADVAGQLRRRWPGLPARQAVFPAYR